MHLRYNTDDIPIVRAEGRKWSPQGQFSITSMGRWRMQRAVFASSVTIAWCLEREDVNGSLFASTGKRDPAGRFLLPDGYGPEHHFRCYEHRQLLPRRNVDGGHVHHLCSVYLLWGGSLCSPSHRRSAHVRSGCADPVHSDHPFAQDQELYKPAVPYRRSGPAAHQRCSGHLWFHLL